MNKPCQGFEEMLVAQDLHDWSDADQTDFQDHLETCLSCRELRSRYREDDINMSAFVESQVEIMAGLESKIMQNIDSREAVSKPRRGFLPSYFQSNKVRLGMAAALLVCLVFWTDFFDRGHSGSLVWAQVLAQVEEAQDFICRRIEKRSGEPAREILEYRSGEFGLRQEIYVAGKLQATQFVIPSEKLLYALVHRDRTFMQMHLTEEQVAEHRRSSNAREMIKSFREEKFHRLGRRKIDGKMAEGIEIVNPPEWERVFESGTWRLWVDLETQWPVLIELEGLAAGGSVRKTYTLKDFQWNATLKKEDFEFSIPSGYRRIADIQALEATEEGTIASLRRFANLMRGRYPSKLAIATAIAEAQKELEGKHGSYDDAAGRDVEALFAIRNACSFFGELVAENMDPAYYGDQVDSRDFDQVLLRWRIDGERYRVIYGDLRTDTVSFRELDLLEGRQR